MKENKYDDNIFFQKYSKMSRSQQKTLRVPSHKYSAIHSRILNQAHAYL